ncbi:hypothetical protein D3C77_581380 [compost metagenome]
MGELQMLRRAVERIADRAPEENKGTEALQSIDGVLLEMLLMLRLLAGTKSDLAQKEIARQGYDVWRAEK